MVAKVTLQTVLQLLQDLARIVPFFIKKLSFRSSEEVVCRNFSNKLKDKKIIFAKGER